MFRKRGYRATSMRDLASEVGMEAASLYNHIRSKQEILQELLLQVANRFTRQMARIKEASNTSLEKLEKLVEVHVQMTIDHTDAIALIPNEWVHLTEPALGEFTRLRDEYEKDFLQIIKDCIENGYLQPVNPRIALFSILSTLRWLYAWYNRNKDFDPGQLKDEMVRCLIDGLKRS